MKKKFICIAILGTVIPLTVYAQETCVLKKDKENIKVFSCKTPGSRFNTVRGEFEVNATFDDYISIVLEVEKFY